MLLILSVVVVWDSRGRSACHSFSLYLLLSTAKAVLLPLEPHFSTFGSALGPGVAAVVVAGGNYRNVFLLSIGLFVVALLAFFYADRARKSNR